MGDLEAGPAVDVAALGEAGRHRRLQADGAVVRRVARHVHLREPSVASVSPQA